MKWVLLLICALAALAVGRGLRARSADWAERLEFLEAELGRLAKAREQTGHRAWPRPTEAREVRDGPGADAAADVLAARIAALQEFLREVEWRVARTHARLPDEEGFKRQLARGEAESNRLRGAFHETLETAKRMGRELHPGMDEAVILKPGASPILEADPQFLAAREAFMKALAEMQEFQKRMARLMTMDRSGRDLMRDPESIARTRQQLMDSLEEGRLEFAAAMQELRNTQNTSKSNKPTGNEGVAEFTVKNALALIGAMETQLAELEFAETVGPLRRNW